MVGGQNARRSLIPDSAYSYDVAGCVGQQCAQRGPAEGMYSRTRALDAACLGGAEGQYSRARAEDGGLQRSGTSAAAAAAGITDSLRQGGGSAAAAECARSR